MTKKQQWMLVGGIAVVLAGVVTAGLLSLGEDAFRLDVGARAPEFTAQTLDAEPATRTLADYKGRVVLLNVWATWCEPCKVEMPSLEELHREFQGRGLSIVAVSVDSPGAEDAIRKFAEGRDLTFDILHDSPGEIQRIYRTSGVPETFVIGRDGIVRRKWWGAHNWASLDNRALIAQLLGEQGGQPPAGRGDTAEGGK